jgi:hypothetical protein
VPIEKCRLAHCLLDRAGWGRAFGTHFLILLVVIIISIEFKNMELAGNYEGDMLDGRFHGHGIYRYQDCRYEGSFHNGKFHGEGILFVKGGRYRGLWKHGQLVDGGFIFEDELHYLKVGHKFWDYCSPQDRRFYNEIKDGVSKDGPLRDISSHDRADFLPKGCYDTIDGYYDPKKHMICSYENHEELRAPDPDEIDFILNHCRIGK